MYITYINVFLNIFNYLNSYNFIIGYFLLIFILSSSKYIKIYYTRIDKHKIFKIRKNLLEM